MACQKVAIRMNEMAWIEPDELKETKEWEES